MCRTKKKKKRSEQVVEIPVLRCNEVNERRSKRRYSRHPSLKYAATLNGASILLGKGVGADGGGESKLVALVTALGDSFDLGIYHWNKMWLSTVQQALQIDPILYLFALISAMMESFVWYPTLNRTFSRSRNHRDLLVNHIKASTHGYYHHVQVQVQRLAGLGLFQSPRTLDQHTNAINNLCGQDRVPVFE